MSDILIEYNHIRNVNAQNEIILIKFYGYYYDTKLFKNGRIKHNKFSNIQN